MVPLSTRLDTFASLLATSSGRKVCEVYIHEGFSGMSKIRNLSMGSHVFPEGSRVRVVSYSPFRGLKGTIRTVHHITPLEELFCFYQIELEGTQVKEPIWFTYEEVELLASQ